MNSEKIKIASNNIRIGDEQSNVTRTAQMMSEIIEMWKEQGIEFTDEEINSLIKSTFGTITIEKIAAERSSKLRPRQQLEEYTSWIDDINLAFRLYSGLALSPFSYYVYCEKGKILIKDGAFEEIEERNSYFLTEKKEIELYNRHKKLVDDANKLSEDLRKNTGGNFITSAWLLHFDLDGTAFMPNTFKYGK